MRFMYSLRIHNCSPRNKVPIVGSIYKELSREVRLFTFRAGRTISHRFIALKNFNMSTSNIPTADSEITDNPDTVNNEATDSAEVITSAFDQFQS